MLQFEESTHTYTVDGRDVASVTQVLSRVGVRHSEDDYWNSLTGTEWMNNPTAAKFGTEFHRVAQITLMGGEPDYDSQMEPWVESFRKFRRRYPELESIIHEGRPLIERPMHSKRLDYCATPDWAAMYKGKPVVIDWKTTSVSSEIHHIQLGAYARVLEEVTGIRGWSSWVVYINDHGFKLAERTSRQVKVDINQFICVLNTYKLG